MTSLHASGAGGAGGTGSGKGGAGGWASAVNILAVRLDNLGDIVMTTPALRAIRESRPGARITLLASPGGARVLPHVPEVDDVIVFDAPWVKGAIVRPAANDRHLIRTLARRRFDAAIVFTVYTQSALPAALLLRLAGVPLRLAHSRENPYDLLSDWVRDPEPQTRIRHEVQRQLDLVAHVGYRTASDRLGFAFRPIDRTRALRKLRAAGVDLERPWVVVHPGASAPSRRYPADRFGEAARLLVERPGVQIVFTGGVDETHLVEQARARVPGRGASLAGGLSLGELGAVIDGAAVIVTNNSGPAHIAAALGTPVVDLYALTNPQHTPWRVLSRVLNHDVPCRNCAKSVCPERHHDCLRRVPPLAVAAAARELMEIARESGANVRPLVRGPARASDTAPSASRPVDDDAMAHSP